MSQSVSGKTAIVTGAGSGINLAFTQLLLDGGCNVVLADLRLRPEGQKVVDAYTSPAEGLGRAVFQETDVRSWKHLNRMFEVAEREFGGVDIVCPGAGVYEPQWSGFWFPPGCPESKDDVEGDGYAQIDVNFVHPVRTSQLAVARYLNSKKKGPKTLVLISSTSAQGTSFSTPIYDATKHAISGFVRSMKRIDTIGMRIVAVAPGITRTPMYVEDAEKIIMIDDERDVWIEPKEIAAVMLALVEKDEINSRFGGTNDGESVPIENGTILEVSKGHVRSVKAFHDPGPTAPGTIASNHDACDEASMALLKEGWGAN